MDSLTTAALVADCNRRLRGARINKIFQPSGEELEFRLWTGSETLCLYLLSRPQQASFYLTGRSFPHPFTPPRFCQLLRSRLSRLLSFEQYGGDRLVRIHFTGKKDDRYQLLLDLRPRPNLILLDAKDRIIDLLRRAGQVNGQAIHTFGLRRSVCFCLLKVFRLCRPLRRKLERFKSGCCPKWRPCPVWRLRTWRLASPVVKRQMMC